MIKKFDLNEDGSTIIQLNSYAKFLSIQIQNDIPRIWIDEPYADQGYPREAFKITGYVTGDCELGRGTYLGTLLFGANGTFVMHYFWM